MIEQDSSSFLPLKRYDTRPLPLWRMPIKEEVKIEEEKVRCGMKDAPLETFICTQVERCPFECTQKLDQKKENGNIKQRQQFIQKRIRERLRRDNLLHNGQA